MAKQKPCRECKHYEKCCYYGGWTDAQWHRYYRINEGRGDCWEGEEVEYIRNASIVDAVLVVRCKDCHHAHKYKHESPYVYCVHHGMTKYQNDFCSNGINENKDIPICLTEDCPYQKGNPCEAWETCGGFEGKENE